MVKMKVIGIVPLSEMVIMEVEVVVVEMVAFKMVVVDGNCSKE